jgi:hypothetical protein
MENNQEIQLRLEALRMAVQIKLYKSNTDDEPGNQDIVEQASLFFKFLNGGK